MATTVKLLTEWNGYPHNAIITLDDGTATGLVAGKIATTTTAGGVVYVPPDQPAYTVPMVAEFDPDTPSALPALKARGQTVFSAAKVAAIDAVVSGDWIVTVAADGSNALSDEIDSPLRIANCELWLDASSGAVDASWNASTDGGTVATVLDNSGNARHATVTSGVYQATGGYNGKPGVLGKAVTPGFMASGWGNAFTLFCVTKATPSAGLRIKVGFGSGYYLGHQATTGQRDISMSGVTPSGSSVEIPGGGGGIDCTGVGASGQRILTDLYGITASSSAYEMTRASTGSITLSTSAVTVGGFAGSTTYDWGAPWSEVIVFSRYLSSAEVRRVLAYLAGKYETLPLVVTLGNSLVSGAASTGGPTQIPSASGTNLPSRLMAELAGQARVRIDAYPGRTGAQIFSESQEFSAIFSAASPKTVSVVWEGTNTLAGTGSIRNAYEEIARICKAKRTGRRPVVVCTVLLRGDTGNDAKNAALTGQLNALIRANWQTFADGLCDMAADSRLSDFNNATYFDADTVHLKDAGYTVCAALLKPVIQGLLA